jgi:hypothetical protein
MKTVVGGKTKKGNDYFKFNMSESEYIELDNENEGLCLYCGEIQSGCEPDARMYECESCEKKGVYGASELLMMGLISFTEDSQDD